MMTIDVSNSEALLSHYADWLKHLDISIADTQAKIARLAASNKKAQPEEKTRQAPAWLLGAEKPQSQTADEAPAPAASITTVALPVQPLVEAADEAPVVEELPVEEFAGDDDMDGSADVELDAPLAAKPEEDGWL